jgi:hypothetical protein
MIATEQTLENLTLTINQEIHVQAPLDITFAALHGRGGIRWRRGQPHGDPAFRVYGERPAERRAVHDWQIRPVPNVMDEVVHIYGFCIQGMAQPANKVMAGIRAGIEGADLLGDGRLLELRTSAGNGESIS